MAKSNNLLTIYVDFDSTLNNLGVSWRNWANAKYNTQYTAEDVNNWYWFNDKFDKEIFDYFKVAYCLEDEFRTVPLPDSVEFFDTIAEKFNTYILTSTFEDKKLRKMKDTNITHYFGTEAIIHEHYKYKYSRENAVLIDDRDWNCLQWVLNGGIAICFNHNGTYKYNENNMVEHENLFHCENYEEVLDTIRFIEERIQIKGEK